jgi:hypothetical protein
MCRAVSNRKVSDVSGYYARLQQKGAVRLRVLQRSDEYNNDHISHLVHSIGFGQFRTDLTERIFMTISADWGTSPNTGPKDWPNGHLVTADDMNTYISNRLLWLKTPPFGKASLASNFSTTSTTFTDVTGLSVTIDLKGGRALILLAGAFNNSSAPTSGTWLDLLHGSTSLSGSSNGFTAGSYMSGATMAFMTEPLTGPQTFKVQMKVGGSTGTLYAGASLFVREV